MNLLQIPKIFHRIWLGNKPIPKEFAEYGQSWLDLHPGWEMHTWTYNNIGPLRLEQCKAWGQTVSFSQQSDIIRYIAILRYGGIYIDTDFKCLQNIDFLLYNEEFVCAKECEKYICPAFFASIAGHSILKDIVKELCVDGLDQSLPAYYTGPMLFTKYVSKGENLMVCEPYEFFPYHYSEPQRKDDKFKLAYAIHYWAKSWTKDWGGND